MEIQDIVRKIFGPGFNELSDELATGVIGGAKSKVYNFANPSSLSRAECYIEAALAEDDASKIQEDQRPGRIGPKLVKFDVATHHGLFIVSPDRLSVNSQSNFSTIKANTALYSGKWLYEVQLGSKGVMQIGWGTAQCKFSHESGVGDTVTSFAYDGNRVRKWNVTTYKYGEAWLSGDIIGCALDLDEGCVSFYRNGRNLGVAFENIPRGAGIAYFPTVSLAFTENLMANFGSTPLKYPVKGYEAPQAPPRNELKKVLLLLEWLTRLLVQMKERSRDTGFRNFDESSTNVQQTSKNNGVMKRVSIETYLLCLSRLIIKYLGPLLTSSHVTEALFIPFIRRIKSSEKSQEQQNPQELMLCLDLMWMFMEQEEMKVCLENTVVSLLSSFRHASLMISYPNQCDNLAPLIDLCRHAKTRQHLLQYVLFDRVRFANFLHVKPLDEHGLKEVVNKIWWETDPPLIDDSLDISKKSYMDACNEIKNAISELECLQVELLVLLLDNNDATNRTPSSRTIFLTKFRRFLHENLVSGRTPLPITVCCFHRLLGAFKVLWLYTEDTIFIPCRSFYDGSLDYYGIDRLGGVLSHLNKTYKRDLIANLGSNHEIIARMEDGERRMAQESSSATAGVTASPNGTLMGEAGRAALNEIPTLARLISMNSSGAPAAATAATVPMILERLGYTSSNNRRREEDTARRLARPGSADERLSLLELLDGIILFYHAAAKKQIAKIAGLRESMSEYIVALSEATRRLESINHNKKSKDDEEAINIERELIRTIGVFKKKLIEQSRHMAWVRAAVYSEEKQQQIAWLLRVVTWTLAKSSQEGSMFSFVPEFYLEALSDLCLGLRSHFHPTVPIEKIPDYEALLIEVGQYLCNHFLDPRIVNANSKDTLILTLAGFVSNPLTLRGLERVSEKSRLNFVTNLLRPYENRAWAQSNWVLVRFWQGHGFAFRYETSPHLSKKIGPKMLQQDSIAQPIKPCPSIIYQNHVKQVLLNNLSQTIKFLNSLLNQLNWAFSEFIGMVQEIHNVSSRPERVFIESRQLKICATCFDLAVSLLRVIEMIATIAPAIFNDPARFSSENLLIRLCQLLCQILNRVSSQTSSFQHVVLLDIPDLETVDHFPILAAVIGILLALLQQEITSKHAHEAKEVPRTTGTLLMEPSFQMSSLYFVLGEGTTKKPALKNIKTFTLLNYKEDVSEADIVSVRDMIKHLEINRGLLPETRLISDDDDTCTICYAYPIAVTFKPCNHRSCRGCIDRHVLNSRECFFCKTIIIEIHDLEGQLLHDLTSSSSSSNSSEPSSGLPSAATP
ncbi:E3 ubiquitin-protein ligase RNF123-like isoform X1 [Venturia canescens]|uniref:E3 ubiquitin-protein ligase RNF123-like isoform X1 n=1 Tax=Venturia canescens TaxID=32260 RepID=UPI001C9CC247|nr:E3 ubiquitin-protein ligase RNF123-like isoform X1 [Venturia canescens]